MDILKTLRNEIKKSSLSQQQIAVGAGIDPGVLSRFFSEKAGLSITNAEKLLIYFGYDLNKKKGK